MSCPPMVLRPAATGPASFRRLSELGVEELEKRLSRAERRIRENGVTYNVYGDPQGISRPWKIDLVPLLIPPEEWRYIEKGIVQRAEVLNLLLADIYGSQKLLASGRLPPALVFANPAFLAPRRSSWHSQIFPPPLASRRPGTLARRPMVGSGRPHTGALRRRLRARKPHHCFRHAARFVSHR